MQMVSNIFRNQTKETDDKCANHVTCFEGAVARLKSHHALRRDETESLACEHAEATENDEVCSDKGDRPWSLEMSELFEDLTLDPIIEEYDLSSGEGIAFESARIPHARTRRLPIDYYGNVFVHIAPKWWKSFVEETF